MLVQRRVFARAWGAELVSIAKVIEESDLHSMLNGTFGPTVQLRDDLMSVYILNRDKVGLFSAAAARATVKAYAHFITILEQQKHLNKSAHERPGLTPDLGPIRLALEKFVPDCNSAIEMLFKEANRINPFT